MLSTFIIEDHNVCILPFIASKDSVTLDGLVRGEPLEEESRSYSYFLLNTKPELIITLP